MSKIDGRFALYVKLMRAEQGMDKSRLARASGISRTTISMMEIKESNPTIDNAWKMLNGLGKTFQDFETFLNLMNREIDSEPSA